MKQVQSLLAALLGALALAATPCAHAQNTIKVGVIAAFSGPFADYGGQIEAGMKAYMKEHGDTVAGKKIELITRDTKGPAPEVAKRLAQELITRDKVQFLAGFGLTPNAMAVAPVVTEAKVPMVISNAATSSITTKSPYITRVSMTIPQIAEPLAQWALKNGIKQVYTVVADYGPGIDAETQFTKTFKAGGGQIVGSVRMPLQNPDYVPFMQRAKDAGPDAVFVFVPGGRDATSLMKVFGELGLKAQGIKLIGPGDISTDEELQNMGDVALGVVTAFHYSSAATRPANQEFVKAYKAEFGEKEDPPFEVVGAYDGMAAIFHAIIAQKGNIDPDKTMELLKGWKNDASPRGPIMIDPDTRDIVQNEYLRRIEKVNGALANVEFETIPMVKDPWKELNKQK